MLRSNTNRKQRDVQRQSHKPSKASGLAGKTWSIVSSLGEICGRWKEVKSASSSDDDVLPTPKNLNQWLGEDPSCPLCQTPATLRHILTGCKTSLSQGRYTWRHNQVLRQLAITLEGRRSSINALPPPTSRPSNTTPFVRAGQRPVKPAMRVEGTLLDVAWDWKMQVDLDQQLKFPPEILTTNLRPDLILWSTSQKSLFIVELTVPWEAAVGEAYE